MIRLNDSFNDPTNFHSSAMGQLIDVLNCVATGSLILARREVITDRDWTIGHVEEWLHTMTYPWTDPDYPVHSIFERISHLRLQTDLDEEVTDQWLWSIQDILIRLIGNPSPYFTDGTLDIPKSWSSHPGELLTPNEDFRDENFRTLSDRHRHILNYSFSRGLD